MSAKMTVRYAAHLRQCSSVVVSLPRERDPIFYQVKTAHTQHAQASAQMPVSNKPRDCLPGLSDFSLVFGRKIFAGDPVFYASSPHKTPPWLRRSASANTNPFLQPNNRR